MKTVGRVLGALLLAAGLGGAVRNPGASAEIGSGGLASFTLLARADPVGVDLAASQAPVVPGGDVAFVAPASAQSSFDSLGGSRSYASAPYAGDFIMSLPSTYNGLGYGRMPPAPTFPFYVTSEHPTNPGKSEEVGSYAIAARSSDRGSDAEARVGISTNPPQVASAIARSQVGRHGGGGLLVAEAVSESTPFSISELLRIGDVRSTVRLSYDPARPDAGVKKERRLEIGQMTVGGVKVGFNEQGFVAGGDTVVPIDPPAVEQKLADSGLKVEYVPGSETATSVASDSLQITLRQEVPGLGTTTVKVILGRVAASIDPGEVLDLDLPADFGAGIPAADLGPGGSLDSGEIGGVGPAFGGPPAGDTFGSGPAGDGAFGAIPTDPGSAALGSPGPSGVAPGGPPELAAPTVTTGALPSTDRFYWVLVVAGAMMLLSSRSVQWSAFRQRLGARAPMAALALVIAAAAAAGVSAPPAAAAEQEDTAVVGPALSMFAFGSETGFPLLCSVTISSVGPLLSDPSLAATAAEVNKQCAEYGMQGGKNFAALNVELRRLSVINPVVVPLIRQGAQAIRERGSGSTPFGDSFRQMGDFVEFFAGR